MVGEDAAEELGDRCRASARRTGRRRGAARATARRRRAPTSWRRRAPGRRGRSRPRTRPRSTRGEPGARPARSPPGRVMPPPGGSCGRSARRSVRTGARAAAATASGSELSGSPRASPIAADAPTRSPARTRPSLVWTRRIRVCTPDPARSATSASVIWSNGLARRTAAKAASQDRLGAGLGGLGAPSLAVGASGCRLFHGKDVTAELAPLSVRTTTPFQRNSEST